MLLREQYSKEFLQEKLREYELTYDDIFSRVEFLITNYLTNGLVSDKTFSELNQFYHEYNLINDKLNVYYRFRDFLKEVYDDFEKRRIVDIGAGQVPQLARELAKVSEEEVVAVDNHITQRNNNISNLKVLEGNFDSRTTLGDRNLLIGYSPCNATVDIINQAVKNSVDFAIAVCDCTYMDNRYGRLQSWYNFMSYVDEITKNSDLGEIYQSNIGGTPLIYTNKRRK